MASTNNNRFSVGQLVQFKFSEPNYVYKITKTPDTDNPRSFYNLIATYYIDHTRQLIPVQSIVRCKTANNIKHFDTSSYPGTIIHF